MSGPTRPVQGPPARPAVRGMLGKAPPKEPPRDRFVPSARWSPPEASPFQATMPKPKSVQALLEAGNLPAGTDLRQLDFASVRSDKALGRKTVRALRRQVFDLQRGDRPAEAFRQWLRSAEGKPTLRQMVAEVRRLVHARYLQGHGLQVPADLPEPALARLRGYLQALDTSYDVVDGVTALNRDLARGERAPEALLRGAERALYRERGVPEAEFEAGPRLGVADLRRLRRFSDTWAPSRSGRALRSALASGRDDLGSLAEHVTTRLLEENGFALPRPALDRRTLLSLLRDLDSEGPRTARAYRDAVNGALAAGERDYLKLTMAANRSILASLGVPAPLAEGDQPDRVRLLRDLLAALPAPDRAEAVRALEGASLADFEAPLQAWLEKTLEGLTAEGLGPRLARRGLQSAANTVAALRNLPEAVRLEAVKGLEGTPAEKEREAVDRLADRLRDRFGVTLHRTRGDYPGEGREAPYSPFVKDFPLQAAAETYGALERMRLGTRLSGATFVFMEGTPPSPPMAAPLSRTEGLAQPHPRPGESLQVAGKSGYLGETSADSRGHDIVVYFDDSLYQPNSDGTPGVSGGEGTMLHEIAHAVQLGGTPGAAEGARALEDRHRVAEWSSLSTWREADGALADGDEQGFHYYYDPAVRVRQRQEVATSYGASDPTEDFAEYSPLFYTDPVAAMQLSPEKFLYFNGQVGGHYDPDGLWAVAREAGLEAARMAAAARVVQDRVASSWGEAQPRPGRYEPAD